MFVVYDLLQLPPLVPGDKQDRPPLRIKGKQDS